MTGFLYGVRENHSEKWEWFRLNAGEVFWTEHRCVALAQAEALQARWTSIAHPQYEARVELLPGQYGDDEGEE